MDCLGFTCDTQDQKITDTFLLFAPLAQLTTAKHTDQTGRHARAQAQQGAQRFLVIKPDFPLVVAAPWYLDQVARPVLNYPRTWLKLVA